MDIKNDFALSTVRLLDSACLIAIPRNHFASGRGDGLRCIIRNSQARKSIHRQPDALSLLILVSGRVDANERASYDADVCLSPWLAIYCHSRMNLGSPWPRHRFKLERNDEIPRVSLRWLKVVIREPQWLLVVAQMVSAPKTGSKRYLGKSRKSLI